MKHHNAVSDYRVRMNEPFWRFHFYKLTGVIPRLEDSIASAWNRLPTRELWDAVGFLADGELYDWFKRHYTMAHPKDFWSSSFPRMRADELRALLPVPDAREYVERASKATPPAVMACPPFVAPDDSPPPWNFTKDFERGAKLLDDVQLAGLVTQVYGYRAVLTKLDHGVRIVDMRSGLALFIAAPTEHAVEALGAALAVLAGKAREE